MLEAVRIPQGFLRRDRPGCAHGGGLESGVLLPGRGSPESAQISAHLPGVVDGVEGLGEVDAEGIGGGHGLQPGLDLDGAAAAGGLAGAPD